MNETINIVWFKRDLRTQDHEPLQLATEEGNPILLLYIFDTKVLEYDDSDIRHHRFVYQSLQELNQTLEITGHHLEIRYGRSADIFRAILEDFEVNKVFSYQESGTKLTWDIDKEVTKVFQNKQVEWIDIEKDGVVRALNSRQGWEDL